MMETDLTGCCFPSYWASYLSKVAEVTLMPVDKIWHHLSYARGLQYVMVWCYKHDFLCKPLDSALATASVLTTPL